MVRDLKTMNMSHTLSSSTPEDLLQLWVHGIHKNLVNFYWMFFVLMIIQNNTIKPEWKGHGLPFHIQLFPKEWTTLPLIPKQRTHSEAELKAVGVIVVYIPLDRGIIMSASKAFSSTFHLGMLLQEEASILFLHFTNGNPEKGIFVQGHRCKPSQIFVNPNLIFPHFNEYSCR